MGGNPSVDTFPPNKSLIIKFCFVDSNVFAFTTSYSILKNGETTLTVFS